MCKCAPAVYIALAGGISGVQLIGYTLWLGLRVGIGNLSDDEELSVLSLLLVNMIACGAFFIMTAVVQNEKAVRMNWIAYLVTSSLDTVLLILWIVLF